MPQEITRSEYERSIDRVRGRRDRTYQIARISGIMFAFLASVTIFIQSRGGEFHTLPRFIFISGFPILTAFGIVLPIYFAYILRESPCTLSELSLTLARRELVTDDLLSELMIFCTRKNRGSVGTFDKWVKWMTVPGMLVGLVLVLIAVVGLCL